MSAVLTLWNAKYKRRYISHLEVRDKELGISTDGIGTRRSIPLAIYPILRASDTGSKCLRHLVRLLLSDGEYECQQ